MSLRRDRPPNQKRNDWLCLRHSGNETSQGGEDGILREIFRVLEEAGKLPEQARDRWAVEFGAWDGQHLSNVWALIKGCGWSGVLLEADETRVREMRANYADELDRVSCVCATVGLDGEALLDALLAGTPAPDRLQLMVIDIDGADYHVWKSLQRFSADVVVIEFNPTVPNHVSFVQPPSVDVHQGSSLLAMVELGAALGYELVSATAFNAFFVRRELYPLFGIEDNSLNLMYSPAMPTEIFQLYDGTIRVCGTKKLLWLGRRFSDADFQIVDAGRRQFPFAPGTGAEPRSRQGKQSRRRKAGAAKAHQSGLHEWKAKLKARAEAAEAALRGEYWRGLRAGVVAATAVAAVILCLVSQRPTRGRPA